MATKKIAMDFGFATAEKAAEKFSKGPSVQMLLDAGFDIGTAAVMVLTHLLQLGDDAQGATDIRNAAQYFCVNRHGIVESKAGPVDVVQWAASFGKPRFALRALRAAAMSGEYTKETLGTLARLIYDGAKDRTYLLEHRADWEGRPFAPIEYKRPAAE